ncbi:MAG: hypothetical protein AAGC57_05050 [Pseudomonadota bacterium]
MAEAIPVPVGWSNSSPTSAFAFFPSEPLRDADCEAFALLVSPAVDPAVFPLRLLRVRAPFDLCIRTTPPHVRPARFGRATAKSATTETEFRGLVTPIRPGAQRHPDQCAIQLALNLFFVADEHCMMPLMPPFPSPGFRRWPGSLVSGCFPLRDWPQPLNAELEWQDRARDWPLTRREEIVYLLLNFNDPRKVAQLSEVANTPALRRHVLQVDNVSAYGRSVGPVFEQAARRRPKRLLESKRIGSPAW